MELETDSLVVKTFVFQHDNSINTENLEISLRADLETIDINYIVNVWKHKNHIQDNMEFKIYDPEINRYVYLDISKPLNKVFMYSPVIMIKYKKIDSSANIEDDTDSFHSSKASIESKRERNQERTIKQVLEYVKQWRQIHNSVDKHKNKINLQQAAKIVGISKKSLDDYYCQLRLAELYGFNFHLNINNKIGILRAFVKQNRPKGDQGIKHQRLPKKLNILQEIKLSTSKLQKVQGQKIKMEEEPRVESIIQAQYEPPMAVIPEDEYQNRFYNSFNFMLDQPQDPFIVLGKKSTPREYQSQSQFSLF